MALLSKLRFRPTLIPTLFTVPALIVMIGLTVWQVDRLQWKNALIAERQARIAAQAVDLPAIGPDPSTLEFRRVVIAGTFMHDRELLLGARSLHGNVGYQVVTPMALISGGIVLVNRGWVPAERKDPATRIEGQIAGVLILDGVMRVSQKRAWLQPENEPRNNHWFFLDVPAMAASMGVSARPDIYVEAGDAPNPGDLPIGGQTKVNLPNDHLQYAVTWALLAIALAVIYVAYHVKLERERKNRI